MGSEAWCLLSWKTGQEKGPSAVYYVSGSIGRHWGDMLPERSIVPIMLGLCDLRGCICVLLLGGVGTP